MPSFTISGPDGLTIRMSTGHLYIDPPDVNCDRHVRLLYRHGVDTIGMVAMQDALVVSTEDLIAIHVEEVEGE